MRMFIVPTLFALLLVISTACAGGGEDGGPTEAEAQDVAQQALIVLEDFPTGWVERAREEDEDDVEVDVPPECQAIIEQENPPGTLTDAETRAFHGPEGEVVESGVNVFDDTEAAEAAMQQLDDFVNDCGDSFETALLDIFYDAIEQEREESGEDFSVDDIVATVNFDRLSFPSFGDDSVALRMTISVDVLFEEIDIFLDIVGTRVGNVTSGFSFETTGAPPDPTLEEQLLGIIERKVTSASSELN